MIKAYAESEDGDGVLVLGLSYRNLKLLKKGNSIQTRMKTSKDGTQALKIFIFSEQTESKMADTLSGFIGQETEVEVEGGGDDVGG